LELASGYALGQGAAATTAIVERHDAGSVARTDYAAGAAFDLCTENACDWYLPSTLELVRTYVGLRGTANALVDGANYWASSPGILYLSGVPTSNLAYVVTATGATGGLAILSKNTTLRVRAIRSF
jgi:hypothetical protein